MNFKANADGLTGGSGEYRSSLRTVWTAALAFVAVTSFHVAYEWPVAGGIIVVYLACLFQLAWVKTARRAFYTGFFIGFAIAALQLRFFVGIFGLAAIGLWGVFAIWIALYLLLAQVVVARWPRLGPLWLPVIWLAFEYFRSELYPLRFAWLTPGFALSHPNWIWGATAGVHGFSFLVLLLWAMVAVARRTTHPKQLLVTGCWLLLVSLAAIGNMSPPSAGPMMVGIQLEGPAESQVLEALDAALRAHPDVEIMLLSEYSFDHPVPDSVRDWCRMHARYLVAGGKESTGKGQDYYDTAYVISPAGTVVFQQAKAVPIQFFNDGLPATSQELWDSHWGRIGIAICYDLSYSTVIDPLVTKGAQALIIPAMDAEDWGDQEHRLHAAIAPVRAREYGIPIFRLASSGISQLVDSSGHVRASAPFPGQGERLAGELRMRSSRSHFLPLDRYLALPAVVVVAGLIVNLVSAHLRRPKAVSTSLT